MDTSVANSVEPDQTAPYDQLTCMNELIFCLKEKLQQNDICGRVFVWYNETNQKP